MRDSQRKSIIGITGATGTLGRELVTYVLSQGYQVVCLARSQSLNDVPYPARNGVVAGDLTDQSSLKEFITKIDICIHLAAYVGHGSALQYDTVNVKGTLQLCEAIVQYNPDCRLVYCSSIAVLRIPRWFSILATPYARSKHQATEIVKQFQRTRGLRGVIIYPGLIYGPGDEKFIPAIIKQLTHRRLFLVSGGNRNVPLSYISDLCKLFFLAAINEIAVGKEYIGVNCYSQGIHDFIRIIARQLGVEAPRVILPKSLMMLIAITLEKLYQIFRIKQTPALSQRAIDILSINFSLHSWEANAELGWHPVVGPEEGIRHFFEWMMARYNNNHNRVGKPAS